MEFGDKIKQLRVKMDLTQEEVAARCNLSKGFISQIERDLTSPSIATLVDMLSCLGTNLKDFFNDSDDKKVVFQKEDIFIVENEEHQNSISWLVPNAQKNGMEPILLELLPGGASSEYTPFLGEVFGYVILGTVTLLFNGAKNRVRKGESFYFKANAPFRLTNAAKQQARVVLVSSPPNF
ncbi:transcriptional regulator [Clostridia bacterium]|nr:transcriptional regulator [Clostridia bacterium]